MTTTTAHVMYDEKRQMTVGYGGRITRKGHWLDVIFISNEDSTENKKGSLIYLKHIIKILFFL